MSKLEERETKLSTLLDKLLDYAMEGDFEGVLHQAKEIRIMTLQDRIELSKDKKELEKMEKELKRLTYN